MCKISILYQNYHNNCTYCSVLFIFTFFPSYLHRICIQFFLNYIGEQLIMQQENISAKAWILMDLRNEAYLRGFNTQEKREIASLTKMYTLYTCLTLNQIIAVHPQNFFLEVFAMNISGTTANLIPNQYISILDLYYALMLPSGNDAASVLAFYYGSWLVSKKSFAGQGKSFKKESVGDRLKYNQLFTKKFVQFMNNYIIKQDLHHISTHFQNCHGLPDKNQLSNVWQLAEACLKFIKNPANMQLQGLQRKLLLKLANILMVEYKHSFALRIQRYLKLYIGIKTGYTTTAGGCLSSITSINKSKYEDQQLLVIVVGSKDSEYRFKDTKIIVAQYQKYLQMMKL